MNEPAEFNERVTKLESEVRRAREDSAAARILAGGADRDVSEMQAELRAHTGSLKALRDTQVEQVRTLAKHGKRLDRLEHKVDTGFAKADANFAKADANFAQIDANFVEVERQFGQLHTRQERITTLLTEQFGQLHTGQERITKLLTEHFDKPKET